MIIFYKHIDCPIEPGIEWADTWSCACNGICPACDTTDIEPVDWGDTSEKDDI